MDKNIIQIDRKDFDFKSQLSLFQCQLDEPDMDRKIKKVIDDYGDRQNHKTNVKAQMTEWKMWDNPGFNTLAIKVLHMTKRIAKEKYNTDVEPILDTLWGMNYKSEEYALEHTHWPSLWSFVYYVDVDKNAPGLFFPQGNTNGIEIKVHNGLLIMFEGYVKHEVKPKKFDGNRYVVSGNLSGYISKSNTNSNTSNYIVN